jgi:Tfp pilus assembly protein FimT
VRTTASDIVAEIAFARAKAIETSRRVYIERTGLLWSNGWRIYADLNNSGTFDAGEELKRFDGLPPTGTMYVCAVATAPDFATNMIFRPDGRVLRTTAVGANDGIYIVDTMGDAVLANNKIRGLLFGLSGRVTVVKMNGAAPPC